MGQPQHLPYDFHRESIWSADVSPTTVKDDLSNEENKRDAEEEKVNLASSQIIIKENYFGQDRTQAPADRKKVLIGPKNNQIDFERILYAQENGDTEVLK